jgi:hypothetical protein
MGLGSDAGMQREPGHLTHGAIERLVTGRQGLQGEHLAASLRPDGNAVGDRVADQLIHRTFVHGLRSQIAGLAIALQQSVALQKAPSKAIGSDHATL